MTTTFGSVLPETRARIDRAKSRFDKSLLRLQGRLDHPNTDRFTPWIIAAALFGVLVWLALARHRSVDTGSDLAAFIQGTWLLGDGFRPEATLAGGDLFAEQAALVLYPLSLILQFVPRAEGLIIIQSLALSLTVVPLWRLARGLGRLRVGVTSAVAFAFCVYSAVHNVNLAGFHPETLALPALVAAARYGLEGRRIPYVVAVIMVLVCRADLGLAIAALGILLFLEGRRRCGVGSFIAGIGWMAIAVFVIQPALGDGVYPYVEAFEGFGEDPFDIMWGIVSNPIEFLQAVFSRANFQTAVTLLAPVLFLPLVAPRYLLPVLPLYALYLAADVPVDRLGESPQTIPMTAFIFIATVFALKRSGTVLVERVSVDRRVVVALLLTASVFFVRDAVSTPYDHPWTWAELDSSDRALLEAIELIPDDPTVAVRASPRALPLLAERFGVYELDTSSADASTHDYAPTVADVDWIVFDPGEAPNWDPELDPSIFVARLGQLGFARVFDGVIPHGDDDAVRTGVLVFQWTKPVPAG